MSFEKHFYDKLKNAIVAWPDNLARDIYAISFFVCDEDDDPRKPTLILGYNTNEHWRASIPQASSEGEAKWNYAFWPHTDEAVVGDASDADLREGWIKSLGLWYSDQEEEDDFDRAMALGERITREFVELAVTVARRLHADGIVENKFGKDLPVLVHELEYYDEIATQNERANPNGSAAEFCKWIDDGCE